VAHAAIDISDGFLADLQHVLQASGVGATIDLARMPQSEALKAIPIGLKGQPYLAVTIMSCSLRRLCSSIVPLNNWPTILVLG